VFVVNPCVTFTVENLTIANGHSTGRGGAIADTFLGSPASVNVINSTFSGNSGNHGGGAIVNGFGTLTGTNCSFSGNSATYGGATIDLTGIASATVTSSTCGGNSGSGGSVGAICTGGGITLTVTNSTFSGNSASFGGGAIGNSGTLNVTNSTFSANSATISGG